MPLSGESRFDVSIYLLRAAEVPVVEATLLQNIAAVQALRADIPGGRFLALPAAPDRPRWLSFVESLLPPGSQINDLQTQAPAGVLWVPHGGKHFLLTFGYAHAILKDEWTEPDFGKKVTLSLVPQGQVVEMRADQVFARRHIASERAPRASSVRAFGFEPDRDLVAAVEGQPSQKYLDLLGFKVRGGTSFKLGLLFSRLLETLDTISERYDSGDYKRLWPQVDKLVIVGDTARIDALDAQLDTLLTGKRPQDLVELAAPGAATGDRPYPQNFVIGRMSKNAAASPYLLFGNWEAWLRDQADIPSVATALSTPVHLLDETGEELAVSTMYHCLAAELTFGGGQFILSSGVWWEAQRQFVKETDDAVAHLPKPSHLLPAWNKTDKEGDYNLGATKVDNSLWLFDKKLVQIGGGHSSLEFCDLMHFRSRTLYFVKQPSSSAGMSHLCEQVRRTAENFFSPDADFRTRLRGKITKDGAISNIGWLKGRPHRQDWNLCLVSMGKSASALPFFARCGIARLVRELEQAGYNVSFQDV